MNTSKQYIQLDLNGQSSMEYVEVRQGDTAKVVSARLTESGTPYELTDDVTAVLAARKPDGSYLYTPAAQADNRLEATLPATFTAAVGMLRACFRLTGTDEAALITPEFTICVNAPAAPEETTLGEET